MPLFRRADRRSSPFWRSMDLAPVAVSKVTLTTSFSTELLSEALENNARRGRATECNFSTVGFTDVIEGRLVRNEKDETVMAAEMSTKVMIVCLFIFCGITNFRVLIHHWILT